MQVVGIDFGTTNIRVSTWDTEQPDTAPLPQAIGEGESKVMPAVIALRQANGSVDVIVGEDADSMEDGPSQLVLRNLKRCALASDPYVQQRLAGVMWESWWDPNSRCVRAWGAEFTIKYLMSKMLEEALLRAGINTDFEWIAGCPVHSGLGYRTELAQIITELGGVSTGVFGRIVEEPILMLVAALQLRKLQAGASYLVYDLGGGSFDCALAQIEEDEEGSLQMVVYGAEGDPALGGSDIDEELNIALKYDGNRRDIREVKESLSPSNLTQDLPGGVTMNWSDIEQAVNRLKFIFKTTVTMRESYRDAKVVWKRTDHFVPVGEVVSRNPTTGVVRFVSQLNWEDMNGEIDGVILCGGTTKSPLFKGELQGRFGADKVVSVSDLIPVEIEDPELTAISAGACYIHERSYNPLFVNRLPVRIELEDMITGNKVEYEPYTHFDRSLRSRANDFVTPNGLTKEPDDSRQRRGGRFRITVTRPTRGQVDVEPQEYEVNDDKINTQLASYQLHLIINRLGQVGVRQGSGGYGAKEEAVIKDPPWQTGTQRRAFEQIQENIRKDREQAKDSLRQRLYRNPWGWQEFSG